MLNFQKITLQLKKSHSIDYSLIPVGILILEIAVLLTEISKTDYKKIQDVYVLRSLHTICLLTLSSVLIFLFKKYRNNKFRYFEIVIPSFFLIVLVSLVQRFFANKLEIGVISLDRTIGVGLLQAFFWFPGFLMVGSKRTEIFNTFKDYEERLIVSTRAKSRNSHEFLELQKKIAQEIRSELLVNCQNILNSLSQVDIQRQSLRESNNQIQPLLKGDGLRKLSMKLDTDGSEHASKSFMGQNRKSLRLLVSQFRILYTTTARIAPLSSSTYALILIILVTPAYINFFSFSEALVSYPLLSATIFGFSVIITRVAESPSKNSLRNSSILIYLTGMLPLLFNIIGQSITENPKTNFPIYIGAVSLPLGYYIFMKFLQVLKPQAIDLIKYDNLLASAPLKVEVTKIVSDEFSQTLSHRWAIFIHGKILTRLAATALKLETAANQEDGAAFESGIHALRLLLENPDREFESSPINLESEVKSRLDPWLGLLSITVHIDDELKSLQNTRVTDLGEVIEEVISNSMRHGKAQNVTIWVKKVGEGEMRVTSKDDALIPPPTVQDRFGLGTRIFNLASDGRWSLNRLESTTEFNLTMGIEN